MKKNSVMIIGLLSVAIIIFTNSKIFDKADTAGFKVGDLASDFELKNVYGDLVSMESYKGAKGFIVVFTCNTCPFSKMYEKRIDELNKKYEAKGFPVLAINSNDKVMQPGDSFDEMVKRAKQKNYTFPYLYDETQKVAKSYGATRTPHVYLLSNASNNYRVEYIGAIDNNHKDASAVTKKYVEDAVNSLINGKEVEITSTKAIGCTIKWRTS